MASTTPVRETILADLLATLEAITTANGYRTNVRSASRDFRYWDSVDPTEMPILFVFGSETQAEPSTSEWYTLRFEIHVIGYVTYDSSVSGSSASKKLIQLNADIIEALCSDFQRNSRAVNTIYKGDTMTEPGLDGVAATEVIFEVTFDVSATDMGATVL